MENVHGHIQAAGFVNGAGERLQPIRMKFNLDTLSICLNHSIATRVGCKVFVGPKSDYNHLPIIIVRRTLEDITQISGIVLYETGFFIANGKGSDTAVALKHIRDIVATMYPHVAISIQHCFHCSSLMQ